MGKKPVLGLVGLAWLGLSMGGCKSCDCGNKTAQTRPKYEDSYTKSHRQPRQQNAVEQQPQEGAVAAKGIDPRAQPAYNYDPSSREPRERESVAEQISQQREAQPANVTPENTSVTKKPTAGSEILQTGRTTETPAAAQTPPEFPAVATPRPEAAVPPAVGTGMGDVVPHHAPSSLPGELRGGPVPPAPPATERLGSVPPPTPPVGPAAGTPTGSIPTLAPAGSLPAPSALSPAPKAPTVDPVGAVAPVGGVGSPAPTAGAVPPAPGGSVIAVPPPSPMLQSGVPHDMPPLPAAPENTPQLPVVQPPTPVAPGQ